MDVSQLISELRVEQDQHAKRSLQVSDGSAFDYGKVVGINLGLQAALNTIDKLLDQDAAAEERL